MAYGWCANGFVQPHHENGAKRYSPAFLQEASDRPVWFVQTLFETMWASFLRTDSGFANIKNDSRREIPAGVVRLSVLFCVVHRPVFPDEVDLDQKNQKLFNIVIPTSSTCSILENTEKTQSPLAVKFVEL